MMEKRTRVFLAFFLFFLSVYAAIAYYATTNKPSQPFIGFGIYSGQGSLSGYTGQGSAVYVNQTYHWRLNVTNEMGTTQFVQIITLLGNNTTIGPNATSPAALPTPAALQLLGNSTIFVANKNSVLQNFDWNVTRVTTSGGLDYLTLSINGRITNSTLSTVPGDPFRLYFELSTFNTSLGSFQYYTWLQIGFVVVS